MKRPFLYFIAMTLLLLMTTVSCKKPVEGIQLPETLFVYVNKTATLTPTFVPQKASNKNVTYSISDSKVATVDEGIITGVAMGRATITATTDDDGFKATCTVIVFKEPEMVFVEGGTFTMGCPGTLEDCNENTLPAHTVTLSSFKIGKYEITQKEWTTIMERNPCPDFGDDFPVERVSWNTIQSFIEKLNKFTGKNYRLPTEAEWEYAARGGNKSMGYKYSGSDNIDEIGYYITNSYYRTHTVGEKQPNELGIYDMSGNVWEWCDKWFGKYPDTPQNNPTGYTETEYTVCRGGGYPNPPSPVWVRIQFKRTDAGIIGFRLVLPEN